MWGHGYSCTETDHPSSQSDNEIPISSTIISPVSSQSTTTGLTNSLARLDVSSSSQPSTFFADQSYTPNMKSGGQPIKKSKYHCNRFTSKSTLHSSPHSTFDKTPLKLKQPAFKLHKRGYCTRFTTPHPSKKRKVDFRTPDDRTTTKRSAKPTGMRILDVGILGEAIASLRCNDCSSPLSLFESDTTHGWQQSILSIARPTTYYTPNFQHLCQWTIRLMQDLWWLTCLLAQ